MALGTEAGAIINKIKEQSIVIIEKITNRQPFEVWIKQQINIELQSTNNQSLSDNFQLLAIIINTIFLFFKNRSDKDEVNFIENFLTNLIIKWIYLSEKEIKAIGYHLKIYNKTDDQDAQIALKKFIDKPSESISFLGDLSKKLVSSCEKSLSKLYTTFKTEVIKQPLVELSKEESLSIQTPFFKNTSLEQSINRPTKYKKIKPRIIDFDEDGIGYEISSPYLYFKEIKRLNNINLEIELCDKIKKKLFWKELWKEELERLAKMEIYEQDGNKLERTIKINEFNLFASKEKKAARQSIIEQKVLDIKKYRERQKNSKLLISKILPILKRINIYKKASGFQSLTIDPFLFETCKNDFLLAFLKTFNYEKFKELIDFSEYILLSIDKMKETLKKIDNFSKDLVFSKNYENYVRDLEHYYIKLKENFNRESISNLLEDLLILFEQRTLNLDNNYCLLDRLDKKKRIVFSEPVFLDKFISGNNSKQIYKILSNEIKQLLNKRMSNLISIRYKNYKSKKSLIRKLLSFFDENYYFTSNKFKRKFIKKIFSNVHEFNSVEAITAILDNLSWRQFFLFHIGFIFSLRKQFRVRLAEELFLDLLEEKFKKIDEKQEPNTKNIDELYAIKNHINSLKGKIQDDSIDLNSLNLLGSRQAIANRFENNKEIENLLRNVSILFKQASSCINEFNNLKDACKREGIKVTEYSQLEFNKNEVSKLHIPLKWTR